MGNVCARCDRTDCPTLLQRPEPYQWEPRDSCYVSLAWEEWRDAVESAASDCRNHVVDWRAEALTLRAQVATLRAECDAARADLARVRPVVEAARDFARMAPPWRHADRFARLETLRRALDALPAATPPTAPVGLDMICALDYLADDCSIATIGKHQRRFHGCTLTDEQIAAALAATEAP